MGFNKCYLRKETIQEIYKRDKLEGVKKYLRAYDAFIGGDDDWCSNLINKYYENKLSDLDVI